MWETCVSVSSLYGLICPLPQTSLGSHHKSEKRREGSCRRPGLTWTASLRLWVFDAVRLVLPHCPRVSPLTDSSVLFQKRPSAAASGWVHCPGGGAPWPCGRTALAGAHTCTLACPMTSAPCPPSSTWTSSPRHTAV